MPIFRISRSKVQNKKIKIYLFFFAQWNKPKKPKKRAQSPILQYLHWQRLKNMLPQELNHSMKPVVPVINPSALSSFNIFIVFSPPFSFIRSTNFDDL